MSLYGIDGESTQSDQPGNDVSRFGAISLLKVRSIFRKWKIQLELETGVGKADRYVYTVPGTRLVKIRSPRNSTSTRPHAYLLTPEQAATVLEFAKYFPAWRSEE